MPDKKSLLLFGFCWLILAVISLPSGASAASDPQVSDTGSGSSDTSSLMENQFHRQHLAYLAALDLRVIRAGKTLGTLLEKEHEITSSQENLEEIITMRTSLTTALRTCKNTGIELAHQKIHATSIEYIRMIRYLMNMASKDTLPGQKIDQRIGVITRAGMINTNLHQTGTDITRADELVTRGKIKNQDPCSLKLVPGQ